MAFVETLAGSLFAFIGSCSRRGTSAALIARAIRANPLGNHMFRITRVPPSLAFIAAVVLGALRRARRAWRSSSGIPRLRYPFGPV